MTDINNEIRNLEKRLDKLVAVCRQLREENLHLKIKGDHIDKDHAILMEKSRIARSRVDSIISRLKEASLGE